MPLLLTSAFQLCVLLLLCIHNHYDGDLLLFMSEVKNMGVFASLHAVLASPLEPTAVSIVVIVVVLELLLMRLVPGPRFESPRTANGHLPVYCANGLACYVISLLILLVYLIRRDDSSQVIAVLQEKSASILSSVHMFAVCTSLLLVIKSQKCPSPGDPASPGHHVAVDYLLGSELYPRVWRWDVKQFISCRFGLISWQLIIVVFTFQQMSEFGFISSAMFVSVMLQSAFICSVLSRETELLSSQDFSFGRVGYLFCWRWAVWLPGVPGAHTLYLARHPVFWSPLVSALVLSGGLLLLWFWHRHSKWK